MPEPDPRPPARYAKAWRNWEFDGLVVSDWRAGRSTEAAANAGLDLIMPGPSGPWGTALIDAVRHGRVSQATLDDKVLRLLRLAVRVGALNRTDPAPRPAEPWTAEQAQDILRSTAASGFVLARNERALLPLDPQRLRRLAVLGPNAAVPQTVGGGSATVFPPYCVSTLEGLRAALAPDITVHYSPGVHSHTRIPVARPALLRLPDDARPGALVEFLDASGSVLGTEQRLGGSCTWRMLPDAVQPAQLATVRVTTAIRAREPGRHLIGCSGHGHFRMTIAGRPAFATPLSVPPGTDPTEAHVRPPQRYTAVDLDAGQSVDVLLEYQLGGSGAGTSFVLGGVSFQLNVGEPYVGDSEEIACAVRLARDADVAIVVVGTNDETESEGFDRTCLDLPGRQDELLQRVADVNPHTVTVVNSGSPVLLPWADAVPVILLTSFPGPELPNVSPAPNWDDLADRSRFRCTGPS